MGNLTYLGMLAPWALAVLLLQWMIGYRALWPRRRLVVLGSVLPAAYLVVADSVALSQGIWTIHSDRIVGIKLGNVPLEEALFFLVTNLMVVQSVILLSDVPLRRRAGALVQRLGRRMTGGVPPDRPQPNGRRPL